MTTKKICDFCGDECKSVYVDASVPRFRVWATLCTACAKRENVKYGTGLGQMFTRTNGDQNWTKVKG